MRRRIGLRGWVCVTLGCISVFAQNPIAPGVKVNSTSPSATAPDERGAFLRQAIEINAAEIQLGRLALAKTQNPQVREYAEMMIKDHIAGLEKFQKLQPGYRAGQRGVPPLSAEDEKLKVRLSDLTGEQFDREYMGAMVSGHRDAVTLFERQANARVAHSQNKDVAARANALAKQMLPMLRKHLERAEQVQRTLLAIS
ncbi:MAG TPA: DUF4142 domain-containing protein [Terriglobia bacterium]|nr:DUF4142 domain-containing protein [Terriglobia bacterium]